MRAFLKANALSLFFGLILVLTLVGQAFAGLNEFNASQRAAYLPQLSLGQYVTSADFAVDVAENWQSEFLQFTLMILATVWLVQRGSPESKSEEEVGLQSDEQQRVGAFADERSPALAKVGGWRTGLFSWSLTLTMATIFLFCWAAQAVAGWAAYNELRLGQLQDPLTLQSYVGAAEFWSRSLQNWQSEFLAVGSMAVLSVYLRQRGSSESKAVGAPHDSNG